MNIYPTGHQCRCPGCKAHVDRGVRDSDSQYVAICAACGNPPLDIEQPPAQPLSAETRNAIISIPILSDADQELMERMTRLRDDMTWHEFFPLLGIPASVCEARFLGPLRHGNLDPVRTKRLTESLDNYERSLNPKENPMRSNETSPADETSAQQAKPEETIQDKAIRRVQELKGILHVTWDMLRLKMGYESKTAIPNMVMRHKLGQLGETAAEDLLERVRKVEAEMGLSEGSSGENAEFRPFATTSRDAISALRQFKQEHGGTWDDVAEALNSTGGDRAFQGKALTVAISPSNKLSEQYAEDILRAIDSFDIEAYKKEHPKKKNNGTGRQRPGTPAKAQTASPSCPPLNPFLQHTALTFMPWPRG